jgi:hypothetical protein
MDKVLNLNSDHSEQTIAALRRLRPSRLGFLKKRDYVFRTFNHTVGWISAYLSVEISDLSDFLSDNKYYNIVIVENDNYDILRIVFRLGTINLVGYTEYGLEVRFVDNFFACKE